MIHFFSIFEKRHFPVVCLLKFVFNRFLTTGNDSVVSHCKSVNLDLQIIAGTLLLIAQTEVTLSFLVQL